ncbi:zinc finger protein ZPR1-like protein [Cucumis melo var. makuwa]|uniref:Zinc finger protein ZPR1-like protein n=1 Tax=Cucumis melo var. makuwa TaxID=1194695 RepID=A0A5D3B956_CUCMM|nr:zinc finger protein ZPR1-like protein [Cucumis melo var. makuwa]TYJ95657.1 zinc finger protein ZPR1-like protein [Cucumis melo var. makuwa]
MSKVEDVENKQLNVLEIVISHRVDEHIEDDTLCNMSSFLSNFNETYAMFLEFAEDLNNHAGGGNCHRHFKKYSGPEEACANPPHILVGQSNAGTQSLPTQKGSWPLSRDEICKTMLGTRLGYSKSLGWGPKPKSRKTTNARSASTSCLQSTTEL